MIGPTCQNDTRRVSQPRVGAAIDSWDHGGAYTGFDVMLSGMGIGGHISPMAKAGISSVD